MGADYEDGDVDGVTNAVDGLAEYEVAEEVMAVRAEDQEVKAIGLD